VLGIPSESLTIRKDCGDYALYSPHPAVGRQQIGENSGVYFRYNFANRTIFNILRSHSQGKSAILIPSLEVHVSHGGKALWTEKPVGLLC